MSPSVSHNSPWHSADLWWCFPHSCLYLILLSPGLAPSVQWRRKIKLLSHLFCVFPSPLAIPALHSEAAEAWPCLLFGLRFFLPPCSNTQTQSFDRVLGNCCSSASPLVSSALLPSHQLSFFNIALVAFCNLLSGGVPWTLLLFWLLQALLCSVGSHPSLHSSSSRETRMTAQTSSVKNVFSKQYCSLAVLNLSLFAFFKISFLYLRALWVLLGRKISLCFTHALENYSSAFQPCLMHVQFWVVFQNRL